MTPRLGFLGVGWIGHSRLLALHEARVAEIVAVADVSSAAADAVGGEVDAVVVAPDALLDAPADLRLDGVVIATPSALHAAQATRALEHGLAVFCQKPLARSGPETARVLAAAQEADRLLGVDLSYRHVDGMDQVRDLVASGAVGDVHAVELVFNNAYGPDKPWFLDPALAGGGCVIDLGTHLLDLALWVLDDPKVADVSARLFAGGRPLVATGGTLTAVEDHALVRVDLADGCVITATCSWFLPIGRDCEISATFYGTEQALRLHNVGGSFYDLVVERHRGTSREVLAGPDASWGGGAIVQWARALGRSNRYDPSVASVQDVADLIDGIYGR